MQEQEFELPKNECPLCGLKIIAPPVYFSNVRDNYYSCPNCGYFTISYFTHRHTPISTDATIRAKLSYFIHHNSSIDKPISIQMGNYEQIISSVILPSAPQQINNLLLWFGEHSDKHLDTVDGNTCHLPALIGCKNPIQVIYILDELLKVGYIEMETPTTGPLRERPFFSGFCGHLTSKGIERIEEIKKSVLPIDYNIGDISVEDILAKEESSTLEIKGSCKLDLNRLLKGDGNRDLMTKLAVDNVLKEIVAFLNAKGGIILIGALEVAKFTKEQMNKIPYKQVGNYYVIGIEIEDVVFDHYQLMIREMISHNISQEVVELVEIIPLPYNEFILCKIVVNKASHKWYYLNNDFYVRDGNRTIKLERENADSYKKRNPRN